MSARLSPHLSPLVSPSNAACQSDWFEYGEPDKEAHVGKGKRKAMEQQPELTPDVQSSDSESLPDPLLKGLVWDGSIPGWDQGLEKFDVASEYGESLCPDEIAFRSTETSPNSQYYDDVVEHGRRYASFGSFGYPLPNDEAELAREEQKHHMLLSVTRGSLYYSKFVTRPTRIMELGAGAGYWAVDVGDKLQNAYVRAIDITPTGISFVPPNVRFLMDDCEVSDLDEQDYDLVFARDLTSVLKNVRALLRNAHRSLSPGGSLELHEAMGEICCLDDTMAADDPVNLMMKLAQKAYRKAGLDLTIASRLGLMMAEEGFENVSMLSKKIPIGAWAKGNLYQSTGATYLQILSGFFHAMAARPLHSIGMTEEEILQTVRSAQAALWDKTVHRYITYYFWWGTRR